jgi:purine-binding chemotaxis protein CheW
MSTAAVAQVKDEAVQAVVEVCSVRLGKTWFGVPISRILEIVGRTHPQPVPLAPKCVGGLVHYRGDVLTTVSLRQLLDMPPVDDPQDIIVMESAGGCFGVLVDAVGEVLNLNAADYEQNPSTLDARRRALFAGTYKLQDRLLIMLDPEQLDPVQLSGVRTN